MVAKDILFPAILAIAGIFFTLKLEQLVRPRCCALRRPVFSMAMHSGFFLLAWFALILILRRPFFSLLLLLAGQFLITQVSNAKFGALREPFVFSDFGIFSQVIRHPRLYLPFLGARRAILICITAVCAIVAGWAFEARSTEVMTWAPSTGLGGAFLLSMGLVFASKPLLDPIHDLQERGLLVSLVQYWVEEKRSKVSHSIAFPAISKSRLDLPDVVVIQSESFFDARRLYPGIRREVLQHFDEACAASALHGQLSVPAWGANTMRSEFAFLSGTRLEDLGIDKFNPYRRATRRPMRALPQVLREAGYRTTAIHPHPARFFRRDRAFPHLGFDRFLDMGAFQNAKRFGPYVSDEAVTDQLLGELDSANFPSFYFVITMENHGPLHLERVHPDELGNFYSEPPPPGCENLTVYLRHLRNADRQLGRLRQHLAARSRPAVLCFYGEHVPSMPKVYDALGFPHGRTDFVLESSFSLGHTYAHMSVNELAHKVLGCLEA